MYYFYLDESNKEIGDNQHCMMGGILISPDNSFEIRSRMNSTLNKILRKNGGIFGFSTELHFSDFLREWDDKTKLHVLKEITKLLDANLITDIIISHCFMSKKIVYEHSKSWTGPFSALMQLTYWNLLRKFHNYSQDSLIQFIIDGAFQESFKKIADGYSAFKIGADMGRELFKEEYKPLIDYKKLLEPVYIDSKDSRHIQISDIILGVCMVKETCDNGFETPYKKQIADLFDDYYSDFNWLRIHANKEQ
ncbi:MAG: DUF3800 domain-containing protein [Deltaproteobacteria bacterium]|nr:DUF3800 domain-containing protein [Deltaproteobacteria bacterium]MBW2330339.1 DUF3800 domain-containing protein [Deltaproteobacteria bacterium]